VPKQAPPNSFVLHAPLELLARAILLPRVPEPARDAARARLRWVADTYAAAGPSTESPVALADLDLTEVTLSLAAAGHAPILWSLRRRVPGVADTFGLGLVITEVGRYPDWTMAWPAKRDPAGVGSGDLASRLAGPHAPGDPGSDFIYPTMHLVDDSGFAEEVLTAPLRGMAVEDARRELLRIAAQSMLQDNPDAAPYGWTHCLTMPQAVLRAVDFGADPDVAVAVAGLYVLGFRSTQGRVSLDADWRPRPESAAARVWSASSDEQAQLIDEFVAYGAAHEDAHLAKYTLACLDAAEDDPEARTLFLAALAQLQEWWQRVDAAVSSAATG
jgi:hypothetical protein